MATPSIVTQTGTGTSAWIPVDYTQANFGIGFGCVVSGTVTYDVQHTFDNIQDISISPTAFTHSTVTGETANQDGNYAFPIRAIRLNVTAGSGSVTITVLQGRK
jgi:hypothetical protein